MISEADPAKRAKAFFDRPEYQRMLKAVWKKYTTLGRIGGNAVVERVSEAESEALNSFFGWNCKQGDTVDIPLVLLEKELRESAFSVGILELHTLLEDAPLLTKQEQRYVHDKRWRSLFTEARKLAGETSIPISSEWLTRLENGQGAGIRTFREHYKMDLESALASLIVVVRALDALFMNQKNGAMAPVRLPVLAARVSGDPHALDGSEPAGRMLIAFLRERLSGSDGQEKPEDELMIGDDGSVTLKLREMYRSFGILDDDLSSIVYWFVPELNGPILPCVWTLRQVEAAETLPRCSRIHVVENPAVFSMLLDSLQHPFAFRGDPPALICTSGPASAAAIRWIQRCLESSDDSCLLYYSGDFDVKGLSMGQTLAGLFSNRFHSWRFCGNTFREMVHINPGPSFDDVELAKLEKMKVVWDEQLCVTMRQAGKKVYQETFVEQMAKDFIEIIAE